MKWVKKPVSNLSSSLIRLAAQKPGSLEAQNLLGFPASKHFSSFSVTEWLFYEKCVAFVKQLIFYAFFLANIRILNKIELLTGLAGKTS